VGWAGDPPLSETPLTTAVETALATASALPPPVEQASAEAAGRGAGQGVGGSRGTVGGDRQRKRAPQTKAGLVPLHQVPVPTLSVLLTPVSALRPPSYRLARLAVRLLAHSPFHPPTHLWPWLS